MQTSCLILLFFVLVLSGRTQTSQLTLVNGTVFDANGAVIVNATVIAIDQKNQKFKAKTNDEGIYNLQLPANLYSSSERNFQIAIYDITVHSLHFEPATVKGFNVVPTSSDVMRLDFSLNTIGIDPCHDPTACMGVPIEKREVSAPVREIIPRSEIKKLKKEKVNKTKDNKINNQ